jgi:hypothetical protein
MAPQEEKIALKYLNIKGLAEPVRLALYIGGIEFEDERVTYDDVAGRLHPLPGVRLFTQTILAIINWCVSPYALPGLSLPGVSSDWLQYMDHPVVINFLTKITWRRVRTLRAAMRAADARGGGGNPTGQVPVLSVAGVPFSQSSALLRWAGAGTHSRVARTPGCHVGLARTTIPSVINLLLGCVLSAK